MKFKFNYHKKEIEIDVEECRGAFSQALGLMFGIKKRPLLFVFKNKKRRAIHSFFCEPFVAIWFDEDEIVDVKVVRNWKFLIKPGKRFDKLLEIPIDNKNFFLFADGRKV